MNTPLETGERQDIVSRILTCRGSTITGHDALLEDAADTIQSLRAQLAEKEKERVKSYEEMVKWRAAIQRLTPGGSEYMTPQAVEEWAAMLRNELHEARVEKVKALKQLSTIREETIKKAMNVTKEKISEIEQENMDGHFKQHLINLINKIADKISLIKFDDPKFQKALNEANEHLSQGEGRP